MRSVLKKCAKDPRTDVYSDVMVNHSKAHAYVVPANVMQGQEQRMVIVISAEGPTHGQIIKAHPISPIQEIDLRFNGKMGMG